MKTKIEPVKSWHRIQLINTKYVIFFKKHFWNKWQVLYWRDKENNIPMFFASREETELYLEYFGKHDNR